MAIFEIIMPKMGESIIEATNIKWLKKPDTDIKPDITYHVPTETGCLISDDLATPTRFYSPLVKSIAKKVNIALQKLEKIESNGKGNHLTKDDILNYLKYRSTNRFEAVEPELYGAFVVTNFESFDSLTGTPIINQPQVAFLRSGAIKKRPEVLETSQGDVIAIRHTMIISLAYDHRIVDGAPGEMYLKQIKERLENFDLNQDV
ncbi:MAG: hypothetical protein GX470_06900 [Lentimicrobium sp.]|jgi:pyruvate/2-oxoglutarate dehydrogenase complex dihydrolipoamide acyltransferase (E2) component|nr:hypothetical protein [Lentimicrobium sp.]